MGRRGGERERERPRRPDSQPSSLRGSRLRPAQDPRRGLRGGGGTAPPSRIMALEAAPLSRLRSRRAALLRKGVSFESEPENDK